MTYSLKRAVQNWRESWLEKVKGSMSNIERDQMEVWIRR
jgi:hypothetical protein